MEQVTRELQAEPHAVIPRADHERLSRGRSTSIKLNSQASWVTRLKGVETWAIMKGPRRVT